MTAPDVWEFMWRVASVSLFCSAIGAGYWAVEWVARRVRLRAKYLKHLQPASGRYLDAWGWTLGLERMRWRSWRTLWLWRTESDDAFRQRCHAVMAEVTGCRPRSWRDEPGR